MSDRSQTDLVLLRRVMVQARPHWPRLALILGLSLLSIPLVLLTPLPLKLVVDSVLGSTPLPPALTAWLPAAWIGGAGGALAVAVGLLALVTLLVHLRSLVHHLVETYTGERLVAAFRARLFGRVQHLSLAYHDRKGATHSLYRIQWDAPCIQWIAVQGLIPLATSLFALVGMIYVTARIDAQLALVALLVVPALFLTNQLFRRGLRSRWARIKDVESATMGVIQEALSTLRVVKAFGQERREQERFLNRTEESVRWRMAVARVQGSFDFVVGSIVAAGTATALVIGVGHVRSGDLTLGNLLLVMAYLGQLYGPLQSISKTLADLQQAMASAARAFALLDEAPEVAERSDARPLGRAAGALVFRNVGFAYPEGTPVLEGISFSIPALARVGITGPTGAGKTTLVSLLTRFYDPTDGSILLDGIDLRDYRLRDLRDQFAIVLQEPVLFSTTIAENIAYGRPDASLEEIERAARMADAHDFISSLRDGYETQVGERGMTLSGGERQRVALARAFLKDAPILILDEPTSSVDLVTERAIVEATEQLMEGRTTFIIAHRPSTLRSCTVQLQLDGGRLVVEGQAASGA